MASQKRAEQVSELLVKQAGCLVCLLGMDEFAAAGLDVWRLDVLQKQRNRCLCDPGDRRPDDTQRRHGLFPREHRHEDAEGGEGLGISSRETDLSLGSAFDANQADRVDGIVEVG